MFRQRGFTKQALLAASAICAFSATAAWSQAQNREPESSQRFVFKCQNDEICAQCNDPEREKVALKELEDVRTWFDSMGYPDSLLPAAQEPKDPENRSRINITDVWGCNRSSDRNRPDASPSDGLACVRNAPLSGRPDIFNVKIKTLTGDLDALLGTLTHESVHTLYVSGVSANGTDLRL